MRQRYLGNSGLRVSRLGLGTQVWGTEITEDEARLQLKSFVAAGGTVIDTAASYTEGVSESIIGRLLNDVVARQDMVIITKAGVVSFSGNKIVDLSRRALLDTLDSSLHRLKTDHIDLWLAQDWDPYVPLEETISALDYALQSGKVRYVGVSGYTAWQIALAQKNLNIVAAGFEYSLICRGAEQEIFPLVDYLGLGSLAYAPLGGGILTGKYRKGTPVNSRLGKDRVGAKRLEKNLDGHNKNLVEALATAAKGLDYSSLNVALVWARDNPLVSTTIVGVNTVKQLEEILKTESLEIPIEIREVLDEI